MSTAARDTTYAQKALHIVYIVAHAEKHNVRPLLTRMPQIRWSQRTPVHPFVFLVVTASATEASATAAANAARHHHAAAQTAAQLHTIIAPIAAALLVVVLIGQHHILAAVRVRGGRRSRLQLMNLVLAQRRPAEARRVAAAGGRVLRAQRIAGVRRVARHVIVVVEEHVLVQLVLLMVVQVHLMMMGGHALRRRVIGGQASAVLAVVQGAAAAAAGGAAQVGHRIGQHQRKVVVMVAVDRVAGLVARHQPVLEGAGEGAAQAHVAAGLQRGVRWRCGQRGATAWSLDAAQGLSALLAGLGAFLWARVRFVCWCYSANRSSQMETYIQQLEPVLQAEVGAQQHATLAAEKQSDRTVRTSVQPFDLLDVHEFHLRRVPSVMC